MYSEPWLNLGNAVIGGSHWVAVNNETKEYFDALGAPPPDYIPKDYTSNNGHTIQNLRFQHCGTYCCLWLYYSSKGNTDKFFRLFKKGYYE